MLLLVSFELILLTFFCWHISHGRVNALRDVRVKMPHAVRRGEKAILKCYYDMEGDSLYSVKWYKGRREFYRYTPKENPAMKTFPIQGAKVDRHASNESQLTLDAVQLSTTGKYSCEVSADAPSFHTLIGAGELDVVETPNNKPVITGIRPRYRVGDSVRGNCTSRHSRPAANLTWTINNHETNPAHIRHHRPIREPRLDMETAISSIQFLVTEQHFVKGKLKIRCSAHIHDVYWQSTEKSIEEYKYGATSGSSRNSVDLLNSLPYDQFSLQGNDLNENKDAYFTHVQGDVSSLNSGSASREHILSKLSLTSTTISFLLFIILSDLFTWLHLNSFHIYYHQNLHQHPQGISTSSTFMNFLINRSL